MTQRVTREQKDRFKSLLENSGLPHRAIKVFGAIKMNIQVETHSFKTAEQWGLFLHDITKNNSVKFHETLADYANGHKSDTCLNKRKQKIWRVYATI